MLEIWTWKKAIEGKLDFGKKFPPAYSDKVSFQCSC